MRESVRVEVARDSQDERAEEREEHVRECLGHGVGEHFFGRHVRSLDLSFSDFLPDEVMLDVNVLRALVSNGVVTHCDRRLVVLENVGRGWLFVSQIFEKSSEPDCCRGGVAGGHVLGFAGAEGHGGLPARSPHDSCAANVETVTGA